MNSASFSFIPGRTFALAQFPCEGLDHLGILGMVCDVKVFAGICLVIVKHVPGRGPVFVGVKGVAEALSSDGVAVFKTADGVRLRGCGRCP